MIVTANRIPVNPEYAEAFEARFANRAGLVDTMPGFISNHVLRPATPDTPYVVLTYWESKEHFDAWVSSDAFKQGHARSGSLPPEAYSGRNQFEMFEVVASSER
ncbi:MAG: antibiotic biosynthesis monooxygenase [Anaerolineae bacterium]|nr:antibiotic biosynthesis monooxygenase [Anaerolineae bacterium]